MRRTRYLIVGGGLAADSACRGILEVDPDPDAILLVAGEPDPPYARPPLSKALWKGDAESSVFRLTSTLGVHELLGRSIVELGLDEHVAVDERGERYGWEKLLLATGGRPRRPRFAGEVPIFFRTLADYRRLRRLADEGARTVVIGGGFIGSELAAALALHGCPVTMVLPGGGIAGRVLPRNLSTALVGYYREQGVDVVPGVSVTGTGPGRVALSDGRVLPADAVVAGLGIEPNVEPAAAAGLPVDDGIVVDAFGRVGGRPDVLAAGDVARFPVAALGGELRRVEHEEHARSHGRSVGANMAGAEEPYDHLPFFYSDLFDLGYEAVGDLDSRLDCVEDVDDVHGEGAVYYLDAQRRPRGVLLWNLYGRVDDARALVAAGEPLSGPLRCRSIDSTSRARRPGSAPGR